MAATTESVLQWQLLELEQDRVAFGDLDFAYQIQLSEALEASRALAASADCVDPHVARGVPTETIDEPSKDSSILRQLVDAQARWLDF